MRACIFLTFWHIFFFYSKKTFLDKKSNKRRIFDTISPKRTRHCNQHGMHWWCLYLFIYLHLNSFRRKLIFVALEAAVAMVTICSPTSDHDVTHRLNERALAVHTLSARARFPHWLLCKTDKRTPLSFYHFI